LKGELTGFIGQQIQANLENWVLTTPYANPAMIETFRHRDRNPRDEIRIVQGSLVAIRVITGR